MSPNPYRSFPDRSFWKRAVAEAFVPADLLPADTLLLRAGDRVCSAGSCFAANIVPFLENAGFDYVRTEEVSPLFGHLAEDNFSYSKFSARYGNIYTPRQAWQLLERGLGRFKPAEDRWIKSDDAVVDPFRPGLKYPATSEAEFHAITNQHLARTIESIRAADVFVFTLGLTEAWVSTIDGAVFPACPGTIAGTFDPSRHVFHNFSVAEIISDLDRLIGVAREIKPDLRVILTVSPVPLVATATDDHVLVATTYSKSVLRVAAGDAARRHRDVHYFPAFEIVTGPQAPFDFFEPDRREPSRMAIETVMACFLSHCEGGGTSAPARPARQQSVEDTQRLAAQVAEALCEEAAQGAVN